MTLLFSLVLGSSSYGQDGLNQGEESYERWAYINAIEMYEQVYKRGYSSQEMMEQLGNAYYFNARYSEAEKYYNQLFHDYEPSGIDAAYFHRYAQTLQNIGQDEKAAKYYELFVAKAGEETRVADIRKDETRLKQQIENNSGRVDSLVNLAINSPYSDYGAYVHDNVFYYASAKDTGNFAVKRHTWTDASFTSLYTANVDELLNSDESTKIKGKVKTKFNEASAVVTRDGQTMYFTRNNLYKGKRRYDANRSTKLKLYRAENVEGKWTNIVELPFNSDQFNTAHPALSSDENTLYFSSDRPGGFGESDLWKVAIDGENYGEPVNLGEEINTEKRETFPFISGRELYFSSNGRVGLGGLDLYGTQIKSNGFGLVQNLGRPFNTVDDDFAFYIDSSTQSGFLSSNREGGQGNDDIYWFTQNRPLDLNCDQELQVKVVDAHSGALIEDATVTLSDKMYNEQGVSNDYVSPSYRFHHSYDCGDVYRLKAEKEGYITQEIEVSLPYESGITKAEIVLAPEKIPFKEGDDLFKVLNLNPIYFDLDKYNIRPDAALELAKVFAVLEEYPEMEIDIRSHTDSRASHRYNETLSSNRAKSTAQWLIDNGINRNRLTWKGYGENQLVNGCADGVDCSEAEHQMNRRSEFIITKM